MTGFVPDIRQYLARARVSVAPFAIAAGIPNKILEAMAYGLPVVATRRATQGLSPGVAEAVEIGETTEEFAAQRLCTFWGIAKSPIREEWKAGPGLSSNTIGTSYCGAWKSCYAIRSPVRALSARRSAEQKR